METVDRTKTVLVLSVESTFLLLVILMLACFPTLLPAQQSQEPVSISTATHPNLLVDVSARLVGSGINLPLNSSEPIRDCILGATISGRGQTTGTMTAQLAANSNHASIQLNVNGETHTSTRGTKRQVNFWSNGVIAFTAQKTLMFDKYGFTAGMADCCAQSDNRAQCLTAPRLVKHLAWRQVNRQKNEADRIIAQHAAPKVKSQLDRDSQKLIDAANAAYKKWFREPLEEQGQFPRQMDFSTSNNELQVVILQAGEGQFGADLPAPDFNLANDIGIRIHESAFNNLAEAFIGGQTLTDENVRVNVAKYLTLTSHKEFKLDGNEHSWSVTFPQQKPITVKFRDGAYQVVISGQQWTSGRRKFKALDITVTYRIESTPDGVVLQRAEEIQIAPPDFVRGKGRLSPTVVLARRILQRKLEHLFPVEIDPQELVVPGPWEKAGAMRVARMVADQGWLQLSWVMQPVSANGSLVDVDVMNLPIN